MKTALLLAVLTAASANLVRPAQDYQFPKIPDRQFTDTFFCSVRSYRVYNARNIQTEQLYEVRLRVTYRVAPKQRKPREDFRAVVRTEKKTIKWFDKRREALLVCDEWLTEQLGEDKDASKEE
jgi:hypothetical protein